MKILRVSIVLLLAVSGCESEPVDYDECVLKKLSSSMNERVAETIVESCRNKFPEQAAPQEALVVLPNDAEEKVTGRFGINNFSGSGTIYNGNNKWRVEEVTILIAEPDWLKQTIARKENPEAEEPHMERYKVRVSVPPLTSKTFSLGVNWDSSEKHEWLIISTKGVLEP